MIDKQHIINELESRGETELAKEAENKLPQQVDLGNHEIKLRELGLDPQALAARYGQSENR